MEVKLNEEADEYADKKYEERGEKRPRKNGNTASPSGTDNLPRRSIRQRLQAGSKDALPQPEGRRIHKEEDVTEHGQYEANLLGGNRRIKC